MTEYQSIGHAKYDIKYHMVWITKYRYKVITKEIGERLKSLLNPRMPESRDDDIEWSSNMSYQQLLVLIWVHRIIEGPLGFREGCFIFPHAFPFE